MVMKCRTLIIKTNTTIGNKERDMKIELTKEETQAIISAASSKLDDLENLKSQNKMSVGWKIMFDDLVSAIEKSKNQYYKQLKND